MGTSRPLGRSESRTVVARVCASGRLRQVRDVLRPRGVSGLWRSRGPLWLQLMVADRDGRLLRDGDAVAVRDPALESERLVGPTWLHRLDQFWDVLCFLVPPMVLLLVAAALATVATPGSVAATVGLLVVLLALLWVAAGLTVGAVRQAVLLLRRRPGDLVVGQLRTLNPTLTLLHASSPRAARELVRAAVAQGGPVLVLADGITAAHPGPVGPDGLRIEPLSDRHPVLVARRSGDPAPRTPSAPGRFRTGDAAVILGGTAVGLVLAARLVADAERAACGDRCDGVVTSYGDALWWMANRLFGGDPEGLGVGSLLGRSVGVLVTVYGLYVLVFLVGALVRQRMADDLRSAADVVAAYEASRLAPSGGHAVGEPHDHGMLDVGDGQRLYWETFGNPNGAPAVVLHGGPGAGSHRSWVEMFDPAAYRVVLLDQRGCGRSTPDAADPAVPLATNTTDDLVDDLERLRSHLGIERWLVLGVSWGSTLGLAYAQRHPRSVSAVVLCSVTGTTSREIDWITRGMARFLPEEWERFRSTVPWPWRHGNLARAYARLLADPDPDVRERAARAWCAWEERHVTATTGLRPDPRYAEPAFRMRFARLVTHYWSHAAWLGDNELVRGAARLTGTPGVLVHGRADVSSPLDFAYRVHKAWPGSELVLVDAAGHGPGGDTARVILAATDRLRHDRDGILVELTTAGDRRPLGSGP